MVLELAGPIPVTQRERFALAAVRFLLSLLYPVHRVLHWILALLNALVLDVPAASAARRLAPVTDPLLTLSALELAQRIRTGRVSSEHVVHIHIERIRQVNPVLNALVAERFRQALAEAKHADAVVREALRNGTVDALPVFLGVPFTVKECMGLGGFPRSGGIVALAGQATPHDSTAVARLRDAGGIPLGVSNNPESLLFWETHCLPYGRTANPYDPSRMPGGSSGGEGALIGAGASPFGLGGDIGGSLRLPAFFCGVFAHKATPYAIPLTGTFPLPTAGAAHLLSYGVLARHVCDLAPLVGILAGPCPGDPLTTCGLASPILDPADVQVPRLRILVLRDMQGHPLVSRVSPQQRDAVEAAASLLAAHGCHVEELVVPELARAAQAWAALTKTVPEDVAGRSPPELAEAIPFRTRAAYGRRDPIHVRTELARLLAHSLLPQQLARLIAAPQQHALAVLGLVLIEDLEAALVGPAGNPSMDACANSLRAAFTSVFADEDTVILAPTMPQQALKHHEALLKPVDFIYTGWVNAIGSPATAVPMGLAACDDAVLPVGVQLVAGPGQDHLTLAVAQVLGQLAGGWVPP